jgi:hypothetical protein
VVVTSLFLHLASSPALAKELHLPGWLTMVLARLKPDPTTAIRLDEAGRIRSFSETDLQWYVGREQGAAIAAALRDRSRRINELEDRIIRQGLLEFMVRFSGGVGLGAGARNQLEALTTNVHLCQYTEATKEFTQIIQGWSDETRKRVGEREVFELNYGLAELARLQREQTNSLGVNLHPPRMHQIFWSSPIGALLEAIVWSVIGTLVNLMVNVSHAHSRGRFRKDEIWVSISKVIYGPVLSFVLILAIYFGVLNAGTEMRFWLLPLLGFLFGYNTRKLAMIIDRLSEKMLGAVGESARAKSDWEARAAGHAAAAVQAEARPRSLSEMKEQAKQVLDSAIVAATIKQQSEP